MKPFLPGARGVLREWSIVRIEGLKADLNHIRHRPWPVSEQGEEETILHPERK